MTAFRRGTAFATAEIDVSADDYWTMLRDWGAVMKWVDRSPDAPAPLVDTVYKEGDSVDVLPCTRICLFTPESGVGPYPETLIHADADARRIYYTVDGITSSGMRNYLSMAMVDELDGDRCRVTVQSTWDIPADGDLEGNRAFLEAVYNRSMIQGMATAIADEKAIA